MTRATTMSTDRRRLRILRREVQPIRPASPRPQRRDCQGQLLAALQSLMGEGWSIDQATMRPWCSATFLGAQHRITLRVEGADAADRATKAAQQLRDHVFTLRGHIVADVVVDDMREDEDRGALVTLAILTIEDW